MSPDLQVRKMKYINEDKSCPRSRRWSRIFKIQIQIQIHCFFYHLNLLNNRIFSAFNNNNSIVGEASFHLFNF